MVIASAVHWLAKLSVNVSSASMVTVQFEPAPLQAPLQPVKSEPASGVTLKVTWAPLAKDARQLPLLAVPSSQSIPAGELVTRPSPLPLPRIVKSN